MTAIPAIKGFMEKDGCRKCGMDELKALSGDERKELGKMCAEALGVPFEDNNAPPIATEKAAETATA